MKMYNTRAKVGKSFWFWFLLFKQADSSVLGQRCESNYLQAWVNVVISHPLIKLINFVLLCICQIFHPQLPNGSTVEVHVMS